MLRVAPMKSQQQHLYPKGGGRNFTWPHMLMIICWELMASKKEKVNPQKHNSLLCNKLIPIGHL